MLPLSVCGIELSVALEPADGCWLSRSACRCGFVGMLGAFARPQLALRLGGPDLLVVQVSDDVPVDADAVRRALAGPFADVDTGLQVGDGAELSDLDMWLTLTEPDLSRLSVLRPAARVPGDMLPMGGIATNVTDARTVGVAALLPAGSGPGWPWVRVRGYGPGGEVLAGYLAGRAMTWAELGRPRADEVELRVRKRADGPAEEPGAVVLERPSVRIAVGWPSRG